MAPDPPDGEPPGAPPRGSDGRARAREEVRAALARKEAPERTCRNCGAVTRTDGEHCPTCGRSYFARTRAQQRRRALAFLAGGAVLAAGLVVLAVVLTTEKHDRERRDAAAQRRTVIATRIQVVRYQKPHEGGAPALRPGAGADDAARLVARRGLVLAVQASITSDARGRVRTGEIEGPILTTRCGPILRSKAAIPDDRVLTKKVGRYDCVAIKRDVRDTHQSVGSLGYPFVAALNFTRFTYTWCRNTPAQSEAGKALVFVRLDRRCLATKGQALGTGYLDVPDG